MSNEMSMGTDGMCPSLNTVHPDVLKQFPNLFTPLQIGPVTIRNRVFVSSHTTVLVENGGPGRS